MCYQGRSPSILLMVLVQIQGLEHVLQLGFCWKPSQQNQVYHIGSLIQLSHLPKTTFQLPSDCHAWGSPNQGALLHPSMFQGLPGLKNGWTCWTKKNQHHSRPGLAHDSGFHYFHVLSIYIISIYIYIYIDMIYIYIIALYMHIDLGTCVNSSDKKW